MDAVHSDGRRRHNQEPGWGRTAAQWVEGCVRPACRGALPCVRERCDWRLRLGSTSMRLARVPEAGADKKGHLAVAHERVAA